jgi:hypothetical protein
VFSGLLYGLSCGDKAPPKQPLRTVSPNKPITEPDVGDHGPTTAKQKDARSSDASIKAQDVANSLWSRMVPIDPTRASVGVVLVDTIQQSLADCEKLISDHRVHNLTKPSKKLARSLKKQCKKIRALNPKDLIAGAGTAPFLDSLLLNISALIAGLQHLEGVISGKLTIPEDAFNREIEARVIGCTRHLSDVQRGLEPTRQQLEKGHYDEAALAGLLGLLDQPETLIDTIANLIDIRIISPTWSTLMTDVRQNILKGRPPAHLRDTIMLAIIEKRLGRIVSRVEALIREDGELAHGFDLYRTAVKTYLNRMAVLTENLMSTNDYEKRATVLQQLQRIPRDERKSIRDAREFWKESFADAQRRPEDPAENP